ncbi:MAG TPA: cell division protein FtsZ [Fibrobacteraceae bacterium]|nr:cell division protein FtsZ [Fibrobacteraceae bacterium]
MLIKMDETFKNVARIKVVGVGGAGGNAVNRMVKSGFSGVEFIAINTDQMALDHSEADLRLPIGSKVTKGLGAGARPERGFQAIQEDRAAVAQALEGAEMVFITAGMGGGTGTGAAPVVAEIARELGILSVAVVTRPFEFEGPVRARNCNAGIEALRKNVDTIIIIHNQKILETASQDTQVSQAFKLVDDVLLNAVRGICEIILNHGNIQVDFADVRTIMENGGDALMGTGIAEGEGRALAAVERAVKSPLLDDIDICGAEGVLVNISHGKDFGILELNEIMTYVYKSVGNENATPNIIFGHVENESEEMLGKVAVTVIAAGFKKDAGESEVQSTAVPEKVQQEVETPVLQTPPPVQESISEPVPVLSAISQEPAYESPLTMEQPNPFQRPYQPESTVDVRKSVYPEAEFRSGPTRSLDSGRHDAIWHDTRAIPQQEPVAQRQPSATGSAKTYTSWNFEPSAEEEPDRDVPAFLRNPISDDRSMPMDDLR